MSAPIGVALIGSGIFAREEHLVRRAMLTSRTIAGESGADQNSLQPGILATPSLSLKAVYSRSLESAAKLCEPLREKVDWYSVYSNHNCLLWEQFVLTTCGRCRD